jgi:hypothetical protein
MDHFAFNYGSLVWGWLKGDETNAVMIGNAEVLIRLSNGDCHCYEA